MKNKKTKIIIIACCLLLNIFLIIFVIIPCYQKYQEKMAEKEYQKQLANATIIVDLSEDLNVSFLANKKVSDFITNINGEIIDDYEIDTSTVGKEIVSFKYLNEEDIIIPYEFEVNVIDDVAPVIWLGDSYSVTTSYEGNLLDDIVCADNYDDNPNCEIIGEYNTTKVGKYNLTFQATDNSGNVTTKEFTLNVTNPQPENNNTTSNTTTTSFSEVVSSKKTNTTKIGLDISRWQGDIDFAAVKEAGVEFVFIRVGSTLGIDGEYFVDKKFEQNIKGFNEVGIPVGIYFYSYAYSSAKAIEEAEWVIEQIKDYQIDLPIAYDWENWSFYNSFHQSFYSNTKNAKAFLDTISSYGYDGILYSSKNYLEKVWYDTGYPVWLAHYTENTTYEGEYQVWQICSNGRVNGINGNVDIDIMYTSET